MTRDELLAVALVRLVRHNIPTDVQELLVRGNPDRLIEESAAMWEAAGRRGSV